MINVALCANVILVTCCVILLDTALSSLFHYMEFSVLS